MEKREYLERKDFKSLQAYEAYILAFVAESIKRSNEGIEKTNKIIEETNRILLNKARNLAWLSSELHISIKNTFFPMGLQNFIDYNTESPEEYFMMEDGFIWRSSTYGEKIEYHEMKNGEIIDFAINAVERSCLES